LLLLLLLFFKQWFVFCFCFFRMSFCLHYFVESLEVGLRHFPMLVLDYNASN
jgi:hypothetical protein